MLRLRLVPRRIAGGRRHEYLQYVFDNDQSKAVLVR